ncbi:hypothetical protein RvY_05234 [Ramazzottius varieornatus]|uniref:PX domain-containing protein n=1 Tax=Ramazzottius varieornatus TaxID=947166 RepID=A0A1D1V465_RAMVA|nr:hypothetical protein RvY_05234 [Ramazzottius varieornatus]
MAVADIRRPENINISQVLRINSFSLEDGHIFYYIQVTFGQYYWQCKRRYSEFKTLHDKMISDHRVDSDLLPAKYIFGVKNEAFLKKRQVDLEVYLLRLWHHLRQFPSALAEFLDFHLYEIHFVTENLCKLLQRVEQEGGRDSFSFTPIQIYAINKRRQLPEPTFGSSDKGRDFGHLLDFVHRLKTVKIVGSESLLGTSNIVENQLPLDLMIFKSAEHLTLDQLRTTELSGLENVRATVRVLRIHRTLQTLSVLLLRDADGWFAQDDAEYPRCLYWQKIVVADFSSNRIEVLEPSLKLLNNVEHLDLSSNQLRSLDHLNRLHNLQKLCLSKNYLAELEDLHAKLGNVQEINLSHNQLQTLKGLAKMYSLESLDISDNEISGVAEVQHLRKLPCLAKLNLTSNPITLVVDYRIKILACFEARANEVNLDGSPGTAQEISHVNILMALKKSQTSAIHLRKRPSDVNVTMGSPRSSPASPAPGHAVLQPTPSSSTAAT